MNRWSTGSMGETLCRGHVGDLVSVALLPVIDDV